MFRHRSSLVHFSMVKVWLGSAEVGVWFSLFARGLGLVEGVLPLARQVLPRVGLWLEGLLAARCQQAGRSAGFPTGGGGDDLDCQPFAPGELQPAQVWLPGLLAGELARLVWLLELPEAALCRPGWLTWELRHWSLAVSLARLGQVYAALEAWSAAGEAARAWQAAAAEVWRQAVGGRLAA